MWPGFGENLRVLRWVIGRVHGEAGAVESPIGYVPRAADIDTTGIDVPPPVLEELLAVDREGWRQAATAQRQFLDTFGARMPREMLAENDALVGRLG